MPTAEAKLDRIADALVDLRVGMETITGELRTGLARIDNHDAHSRDFEARIRSLERHRWSIPSLTTVLGILALLVSAYAATH